MPDENDREIFRGFSFLVEFPGFASAGFMEIEGLEAEIEFEEIAEVSNPFSTTKLPSRYKWPALVLRRGLSANQDLLNWYAEATGERSSGGSVKRTGAIHLLHPNSLAIVATWAILNAQPSKFNFTGFQAGTTNLVVQTLELVHEGLETPEAEIVRRKQPRPADPAPFGANRTALSRNF